MSEARRVSPSVARNREPILGVLRRVLPERARVLEIASGTGEHAAFLAPALGARWQPSDPDAQSRASIAAWSEGLDTIAPPLAIDARARDWGVEGPFDAVVAINMIHYSPWESTPALFEGAARVLAPGGIVFLYGPYKIDGRQTAASNEAFETWLKERDPAFGVRDLGEVARAAAGAGFTLREKISMPANNLSLVFAA